MKLPDAVVFLPVIVDHQHPGRKAVGQDVTGVPANAVLTLVVDQLDPGIVLGLGKETLVRDLARAGKVGAADIAEDVAQRLPVPTGLNLTGMRRHRKDTISECKLEGILAPDIASLVGDQ